VMVFVWSSVTVPAVNVPLCDGEVALNKPKVTPVASTATEAIVATVAAERSNRFLVNICGSLSFMGGVNRLIERVGFGVDWI